MVTLGKGSGQAEKVKSGVRFSESVQPMFTTAADTAVADEIVDDTTADNQGAAPDGQTEQTTEAESGSTADAASDGGLV